TDGHAVACAVPDEALVLVSLERLDYMDAYEVNGQRADGHSAEAWAQAMFTPRDFFSTVGALAWRSATGVETPRMGTRVGPFQLVTPERESAVLVGGGSGYHIPLGCP